MFVRSQGALVVWGPILHDEGGLDIRKCLFYIIQIETLIFTADFSNNMKLIGIQQHLGQVFVSFRLTFLGGL